MNLSVRLRVAMALGCLSVSGSGMSANLAADFSVSVNPNAGWSFGSRTTIAGTALTLYPSAINVAGTSGAAIRWRNPAVAFAGVYKNVGTIPFNGGEGTIIAPGEAMIHPQDGIVALARYTIPATGTYRVLSSLSRLGGIGGVTRFSLVSEGTIIYGEDATLIYSYQPVHTSVLTLAQGSLLDFTVDRGDIFISHDSTGVRAGVYDESLIHQVPVASIATTEGEEFAGDVASVSVSDNNYYSAFSDSNTLACHVEVSGATTVNSPTCIWFHYESHADRLGLIEDVSFFDYTSNQWTVVAGRAGPLNDQTSSVIALQAAARFRGALGELSARFRWNPVNDEDPSQDGWLLSLDRAAWEVAP